jgi:hypothetical protein
MAHISLDKARAAKRATQARLEAAGQPAAVGITRVDGEYAVKVNVTTGQDTDTSVPARIDGVPVLVEVVGTVRKRRVR